MYNLQLRASSLNIHLNALRSSVRIIRFDVIKYLVALEMPITHASELLKCSDSHSERLGIFETPAIHQRQ